MRFKKIFGFLMAVALVLMLLPKPVQAVATVPDGQYYIDVTLVGGSGRVVADSPALLTVNSGQMSAVLILKRSSGTSTTTYLWMTVNGGGTQYNNLAGSGENSKFNIPVASLDTAIPVTAYSEVMATEIDYTLTFASSSLKTLNGEEPETSEEETVKTPDNSGSENSESETQEETEQETEEKTQTDIELGVELSSTFSEEDVNSFVGYPLTFSNIFGEVVFDKETVDKIFSDVDGEVIFSMKRLTQEAEYVNLGYDLVIEIDLTDSEGNSLFNSDISGNAQMSVLFPSDLEDGEEVRIICLSQSGEEEIIGLYDAETKMVNFALTHFSVYAISSENPVTVNDKEVTSTEDKKTFILPVVLVSGLVLVAALIVILVLKRLRGRKNEAD